MRPQKVTGDTESKGSVHTQPRLHLPSLTRPRAQQGSFMKFKVQVGESTLGRCGLRLSPGQGGRAQQLLTLHSPGKSQVGGYI